MTLLPAELLRDEEHVIRPAANFAGHRFIAAIAIFFTRVHACFIAELVTKFIRLSRLEVADAERVDSDFRKSMKLAGLGNPVVIIVNPQNQLRRNSRAAFSRSAAQPDSKTRSIPVSIVRQ